MAKRKTKPEVGDKIYIPGSLHVYRGADDIAGGLATIDEVFPSNFLSENHFNYWMVSLKEIGSSTHYNWRDLMKQQKELKERYGDEIAHPDPDYREEFNQPNADWQKI